MIRSDLRKQQRSDRNCLIPQGAPSAKHPLPSFFSRLAQRTSRRCCCVKELCNARASWSEGFAKVIFDRVGERMSEGDPRIATGGDAICDKIAK